MALADWRKPTTWPRTATLLRQNEDAAVEADWNGRPEEAAIYRERAKRLGERLAEGDLLPPF